MRLSFICNFIQGGWSPKSIRLGGSEDMIVHWAKILSERGHGVSVYHNGLHGMFDNVLYLPHEEYEPADVTVNVNYPQFNPLGKTFYYSTLTNNPDISQFDAVGVLSPYAKENTNIKHEKVFIIEPGYDDDKIYPEEKVKNSCLYASSPDRGLNTIEKIWPSIVEKFPDATLTVTYGGEIHTPNTNCVTATEQEINQLFNSADIWIHPANGGELYCINAVKAQKAGAIPVYFPVMALKDTVKTGVECQDGRDMYAKLIKLMGDEKEKQELRHDMALHNFPTWEESTNKLESAILDIYGHTN